MTCSPKMVIAVVAVSVPLASAAGAQGCAGGQVVTNTVAGAAMTSGIAAANPEYAQMAALVATVDPAQQDWARLVALQTLRGKGFTDVNMFDLLYMQAKSGRQTERVLDGLSGAVVGTVFGGLAGAVAGDVTRGALGGGTAGAVVGFGVERTVSIVADAQVVQPVFDWLISNPCQVTAAQALAMIRG